MKAGNWMVVVLMCAMGIVREAAAVENNSSSTPSSSKYEKVFSACTYAISANRSPAAIKMYNNIDPISLVLTSLADSGVFVSGITGPGAFNPDQIKIKLLQYPLHGEFLPNSYIYHATQDFIGADNVVFEVEVMGKRFKVIFTLVVQDSNPDGPTEEAKEAIKSLCPQNFKESHQ